MYVKNSDLRKVFKSELKRLIFCFAYGYVKVILIVSMVLVLVFIYYDESRIGSIV